MSEHSTEKILIKTLDILDNLYQENKIERPRIKKIILKQEWNVLLGTNNLCGMVINFTGIHAVHGEQKLRDRLDSIKKLIGKDLFDVASDYISSNDIQERSLAVGSISCISQPFLSSTQIKKRGFTECKDIMDMLKPTDTVAIVGYGGFVRKMLGKCKEIHVTEMRPRERFESVIIGENVEFGPKEIYIHTEKENKKVLSNSDIVMITASTLVNGTFDEVIDYSKNARIRGLYGPSGSIIPDVLFENGLNYQRAFEITNTSKFEYDSINDNSLEVALKESQTLHCISPKLI
ncbi:MAG: hypothetical protein AMQ22_00654 [Candidatus Methanofastidiosum methylothiophilum]|uniref:Putative heavy-metal chelation domain-containing protein n=1 Tax=Candidatus Methanofastidiosum methylothiophilum TaxID=1705564 RepID=A0A150J6G5_9EURY|nr:MAG: hypothetical protein AMQ22_00654 [Candidatus Methanofastidiosum methylthiophilus]